MKTNVLLKHSGRRSVKAGTCAQSAIHRQDSRRVTQPWRSQVSQTPADMADSYVDYEAYTENDERRIGSKKRKSKSSTRKLWSQSVSCSLGKVWLISV